MADLNLALARTSPDQPERPLSVLSGKSER